MFRSTGSYEPDLVSGDIKGHIKLKFRSTGSYEPDQRVGGIFQHNVRFDPQALTSLTTPPTEVNTCN